MGHTKLDREKIQRASLLRKASGADVLSLYSAGAELPENG